jgi:signal transduction histidine kinase
MKFSLQNLATHSKGWTLFWSLTMAVVIGVLDYATSYDLALSAVYLVPIIWAVWGAGRRAGIALAIVCALFWALADVAAGHLYRHVAILVWNSLMLLALFVVVVFLQSAFQAAHEKLRTALDLVQNANARLEETVQQRTAALRAEIAERQRVEELRQEAERQLARREKLAVLGTLAAGIAHEIRNPLTALKARLYTLDKRIASLPDARHDTEVISAEISRLERLVQGVLNFARPEEPAFKLMAAAALLHEIEEVMAPGLAERGVRLIVESSPGVKLRGDPAHLKQVLVNLIRNAAEAMDGAGSITLGARAGQAGTGGSENGGVILHVTDTGPGIRPEVERRLFDPFFSTKDTGTGLGLAIAARIVEKHGGRLQYRTELGRGTIFEVILPPADESEVTQTRQAQGPATR